MRTVKHVTPTHWTWVAYDRENKMVLAAAGGTWSIKGGKYEEAVEFTTDNFPQARGKSPAYGFKVDGDLWTLMRGPEFEIRIDETWRRREVTVYGFNASTASSGVGVTHPLTSVNPT